MLLMQEPRVLLLDEPVAGMTDEETERTGELCNTLAGKHSVIVVEHDMDFVAGIARKVTVLHEGSVLAEGSMDAGAERPARDRSLSGPLTMLSDTRASINTTAAATRCATSASTFPAGCTTLLGRNGVGKTTLLKCLMGLVPVRSGTLALDGADITALTPHARARLGIGYVPQGREIFPRLTVEENLRMGLATKGRGAAIPAQIFDMFPVLKDMLAPARRRPLRRAAAAARHRPRAGDAAEAADPGRAHRGHPAFDHQGHRARDPHCSRSRARWRSCWWSSTTISRARWRTTTW